MELFWQSGGWQEADRHLSQLREAPFQRPFPALTPRPGLTLVRGPRQVGKSTFLKLLLEATLKKTRNCFYYSCEDLRDFKDLGLLIASQKGVRVFLLDEITFVAEWWRTIKKAIDTDRKVTFVITGSNSYDLRKGMDLMPGRWAEPVGEVQILPMLFQEWLAMRKRAKWPKLPALDALRLFMRVGGFPAALAESGAAGKHPTTSIKTFQRWIIGDVIKLGRQELFMQELLLQIAKLTGSAVSLQGLAQKTQLMSYHTAQDYVSILEQAFALRTLFAYDPQTDTVRFKKDRKFYFRDPLIYWSVFDLLGVAAPENAEPQLAELIAAEHLARSYPRLGYYSSRQGEVDFISGNSLAIEVKWAAVPHNISKAFKTLPVQDKRVWTQGSFFT